MAYHLFSQQGPWCKRGGRTENNKAAAGDMAVERAPIEVVIDPDLEDIVPGYLKNRRQDIRDLGSALERNDYETVRVTAHRMTGSGAGYGFDAITDMGRELTVAGRAGDAVGVRAVMAQLADYLDRLHITYDSF